MRKVFISVIVCLSALSILFFGELVVVSVANDNNKRALENVYKSSIYDLGDSLNNLQVNMSKLMVSRGNENSRELITDTYRQAETAAQSVSKLPLSFENITSTVKFFNQVGDWCVSFNRAISEGEDVAVFEAQTDEIYKTAKLLSEEFDQIEHEIEEKGVYASIGDDRILPTDFDGLVTEMNHNSVKYPALIYDGPFSDNKTYCFKALENLPKISADKASEKAKELLGIETETIERINGKTEAFAIIGKKEGKTAYVLLSEKGGIPLMYDWEHRDEKSSISREQAEKSAVKFMEKLGFKNLSPVWYNGGEGISYVNLAPKENGIIYYTDLVKVKVAEDDGSVIGFESSAYCEKNTDRNRLVPVITESEAKNSVSKKIDVESVRLAVIPKGEKEAFCYEVAGKYDGLDYFIYVDAVTGEEINVLRVVNNKQGSLTM